MSLIIDSRILDCEVVNENGEPLGRPLLTLAIDSWTKRVVEYDLSFGNAKSQCFKGRTPKTPCTKGMIERKFLAFDNQCDFKSPVIWDMLKNLIESGLNED